MSAGSTTDVETTAMATEPTAASSTTITTSPGVISTTRPGHNHQDEVDRDLAEVDITGRWRVTAFSVSGVWRSVMISMRKMGDEPAVGADALHEAWIEIGQNEMLGYPGGCNSAGGEYVVDGNALSFDGFSTLMACGSAGRLEELFLGMAGKVIRVDVEGQTMIWSTSDTSLRFARED